MNYNEQNQILIIKKLLKENKTEQGIRFADQLIKQKYKLKELHALIKKALIKKKILSSEPIISRLEHLTHQKNFATKEPVLLVTFYMRSLCAVFDILFLLVGYSNSEKSGS